MAYLVFAKIIEQQLKLMALRKVKVHSQQNKIIIPGEDIHEIHHSNDSIYILILLFFNYRYNLQICAKWITQNWKWRIHLLLVLQVQIFRQDLMVPRKNEQTIFLLKHWVSRQFDAFLYN